MNNKIAVLALIVILVIINVSIAKKEQQLTDGHIVYLKLAPVDPRSLMQGDYMALRFQISTQLSRALQKIDSVDMGDGHIIVSLDQHKIASFVAIYQQQTLSKEQLLLQFRIRNERVKFATNAFFFEEGQGKYYQPARFGQFRVNDAGEMLLVAMYDKELKKITIKSGE